MKIPVNQIKFGIQHCLYSSRNICNIAKIIFTQYQTELGNGGTSIIPKYSVIMLYYAIEELGKAIMLEEKLDDVKNKNLTEITDNVNIFRNHNIKIDKAQEKYPDLFIEKFKKKITKEYLSEFRLGRITKEKAVNEVTENVRTPFSTDHHASFHHKRL